MCDCEGARYPINGMQQLRNAFPTCGRHVNDLSLAAVAPMTADVDVAAAMRRAANALDVGEPHDEGEDTFLSSSEIERRP